MHERHEKMFIHIYITLLNLSSNEHNFFYGYITTVLTIGYKLIKDYVFEP